MKIAIMGTGGVGGYYGGLLAHSGEDVTFIARGPHLRAIREKGLQVKSVHGDFLVSVARATDDPREVGPVEFVLFTTKTYQTDDAAQAIKPLIGSKTVILPLQNGVDAADRIGTVAGKEHLLGGITWLSAAIEAPGIIGQYSPFRRIILGEFDGNTTPRLQEILRVLKRTGATVEVADNISEILWTKFIFISSISAMGALTRVMIGEYRSVQETHAMLADAVGEVVAVARAKGVTLPSDIVTRTLSSIDGSPPNLKPSLQRDVEAERICELESMVGIIVQLGVELGVSTPVMKVAYAILKPGQLKARGINIG
ncbi:MAG TPA: 2-dehydropantoate 2-reductase [Thermodesulfobacteriota bacterium]|nr:2-dehydropantoate 2-reductase [Thermodesulfobacteriota bacterium]